jgi:hypothetical protein
MWLYTRFCLVKWFIELFDIPGDYNLRLTIRHIPAFYIHVFTSRCPVAASNSGRSTSTGFPSYPRASATSFALLRLTTTQFQRFTNSLKPSTAGQLTATSSYPPIKYLKNTLCKRFPKKTLFTQLTQSEPHLLYDWWFTASQFDLMPGPLRLRTRLLLATKPVWS